MITLTDPELGSLELRSDPFVVASFEISSPAPRVVSRNRALMNGTKDDSQFSGARAVTLTIVLNDSVCDDVSMQSLLDQLIPYTVIRRRPIMRWSLPGSGGVEREIMLRGDSAPIVVDGPKHRAIVCQFVAPEGEITTAGPMICQTIAPAEDVELGRTYDLTFDRDYPVSSAIGDRLVTVDGNERAHWHAAIFGIVTNPYLLINGVRVEWSNNGGLDLTAGNSLVVDTREKTMYFNEDPASPRFDRVNFTDWQWPDILLRPGVNTIRFGGAALGAGASMNFCYKPTWAG